MELRKSSPSRVRCGDTGAHHHRVPIAVGCPQEPPPSCRTTPQTAPARPEGSPHPRARCPGTSPAPRRGGSHPGGRRGGPAGRGCRGCPRWRPWLRRGRVRPPAPSPCLPPPPATRLYGTPWLTGRARGGRGARGPVWDQEEVYVHSAHETPKSCVFFPKEICADPKGLPTAPPAPPCPRAEEQDEAPELSTPQLPCPAPSSPREIGLIIWGSEGRRGGGPKRGGESASFCPCHNTSRP